MRTKTLSLLAIALTLGLGACSDDNGTKTDTGVTPDVAVGDMAVGDMAVGDMAVGDMATGDMATGDMSTGLCGAAPSYDTAAKIEAFLEGKTVVMEGADIPAFPNGYDEDVNFGSATQCYKKVTMAIASGNYNVTSELGTLNNAPNQGDKGECDHDTKSNEVSFASTVAKVENVAADGSCYDFTATYTGFAQEGRGCITPDGKKLVLELYFKDQATGHRCADGAVGAATVTLNGNAFSGDSKQIYVIQ